MYIWYINICTVVTLYSIKMVYKEERKFYEERKIRLPPWIHSDFGRVCDRSWKCMEVSLHYRAVRRSGIRIDLFAVSSDTWIADMVMEFSVGRASRSSVALSLTD